MTAHRLPDGLDKTVSIINSLQHSIREENYRRRVQALSLASFALFFVLLVIGETLFASVMFALIQVEILGNVVSGEAFALLVPTVIIAAHVKLHHEGDHFTRWWLRKLSSIGILLFALGISLSVGFAAWQAAQDALGVITSGPVGTLGNQQVAADVGPTSGIAEWVGAIPNAFLFIGLAFGMIITIYVASFALGRALQAFNILTLTPKISGQAKREIEKLLCQIAALRRLLDDDAAAKRKLPFDVKTKFSREAANAAWSVTQVKLVAARRRFDPQRLNDPIAPITTDLVAENIPRQFTSEEEFTRHMADQMDALRMHNLLRVLTGIPENGDKQ